MKSDVRRPRWQRSIPWGLAVLGALVAAAWIATIALRPAYPTSAQITATMKVQAALSGGAKVYAVHCAYCHDTGFGPSIAGRDLPAGAIAAMVRLGPGAMQAFPESQVSDADITAVATYLNGLPAATKAKPVGS